MSDIILFIMVDNGLILNLLVVRFASAVESGGWRSGQEIFLDIFAHIQSLIESQLNTFNENILFDAFHLDCLASDPERSPPLAHGGKVDVETLESVEVVPAVFGNLAECVVGA